MKPTKKGQVEVQFNWIFILIVGAILLTFFVSIAIKQKQASEQTITAEFFITFEKALSGISARPGEMQSLEIPKMDLRYECTRECYCVAYAGGSLARAESKPFEMSGKIIFSPNHLKGNILWVWSKDFTYPFRITDFIFMTSPEVKYLFEGSEEENDFGYQLYKDFFTEPAAEQRTVDKALFDTEKPVTGTEGNYKIKFIFTKQDTNPESFTVPIAIKSLPDGDVTAVKISKGTAGALEKAIFYEKRGGTFVQTGESSLFEESTAYAAILAENVNSYACMMNRAMKRFAAVATVYSEKQNQYADAQGCTSNPGEPSLNLCCAVYRNSLFKDAIDFSKNIDFFETTSEEAKYAAGKFSENVQNMDTINTFALQESCPHIY